MIIKQKRKTLTLQVNSECKIVLKCPLKAANLTIENFIASSQQWLEKQIAKKTESLSLNKKYYNYEDVMLFGKNIPVVFRDCTKIIMQNCLYIPFKYLEKGQLSKKGKSALSSWYKKFAKEFLYSKTLAYATKLNLKFAELKLTNAKTKWGSCNTKKILSINFRAIMLPENLIDYIVVHEICHLVELNHSAKFWNLLSIAGMDYKKLRQELKKYSWLQELLRN